MLLLWRVLREDGSLASSLAAIGIVAASPMVVSTGHYFTAATLGLALSLVSLICLGRAVERRDETAWWLAAGVSAGLATSATYGGVALLVVAALTPFVVRAGDIRSYFRRLGTTTIAACVTFLVVNIGLVLDPGAIASGPGTQLSAFFAGDHLFVTALGGRGFYLREVLAPGFTIPVLLTASAGLVIAARQWSRLTTGPQLLLLYGVSVLVLAELSPRKPLPGAETFVLPTAAAVGLGVAIVLRTLEGSRRTARSRWLPATLAVALLAFPLYASLQLIRGLGSDTRLEADAWLAAHSERALRGPLSSAGSSDVTSLATVDLDAARRAGITHVATSSFIYDTFARGNLLAGQEDYVYERHERYQELFEYPYKEFAPEQAGFGWSQPTVRILDIREPRPPGRP